MPNKNNNRAEIKNAYGRWLNATDRRKKDRYNTNILEKELENLGKLYTVFSLKSGTDCID